MVPKLRKRSTFFSGKKSVEEILKYKNRPLNGGSLLLINRREDKLASRIFAALLYVMEDSSKQDFEIKFTRVTKDIVTDVKNLVFSI